MNGSLKLLPLVAKIVAPLFTVAAGLGVAQWLIATKPAPPEQTSRPSAPAVSAVEVRRSSVSFPIRSQGTVMPRTESTLIARVPGQIVSVADCFDESGFFGQGEMLVQIDRRDYEVRTRRLDAALQAARAQELEAQRNLHRHVELRKRNVTTQADFDRSQAAFDIAAARIAELEAQLEEARNAEADTTVVAPFDGCIRQKHADVGQFVSTGTPLATCFATDAVEVRLPVDDRELGFLSLSLGETLPPGTGPKVTLEADFAGELCRWDGTIVRSEALVDSKSRMVYLVATVTEPYADSRRRAGQPLAVGMFVEATIRSSPILDAVVLPESCVTGDGDLFVIDREGKLAPRRVEILRRERGWIVVRGDLAEGQSVCASRVEQAIPGMQVEVVEDLTGELAAIGQGGVLDLCGDVRLATRRSEERARKE